MPIVVGDRVTTLGIEGVHTVRGFPPAAIPGHEACLITLGHAYGRSVVGDACLVDLWRCDLIPVDLSKKPA